MKIDRIGIIIATVGLAADIPIWSSGKVIPMAWLGPESTAYYGLIILSALGLGIYVGAHRVRRSLVERISSPVLAKYLDDRGPVTNQNGKDTIDSTRARDRARPRWYSRYLHLFRLHGIGGILRRASVGNYHSADLRSYPDLRSLQALRRIQERIGSRLRGKNTAIARPPTNSRNARFFVGPRLLPKLNLARLARASPLFLIALLLLVAIPSAHASSSGGFNSSNANGTACNANCSPVPFASNDADGTTFKNPFAASAQLFQVGVYVGSVVPNRIVILTSSSDPTMFHVTGSCGAYPSGACPFWEVPGGFAGFTVADVEILSGIGANAFNTINLASPVTVAASQWVAVVFYASGGTPGTTNFLVVCEVNCDTPTVLQIEFDFGTANPSGAFSTGVLDGTNGAPIVGASFTTQAGINLAVTQCYGNCGNPPITLANTNSTHTINFNLSITLLYEFQSNLNGKIVNMTVTVARDYLNGQTMRLGIYTVDQNCPAGVSPFSPQCPGFLQQDLTVTAIFKGTYAITGPGVIQIVNGQWAAIGVSGAFKGLDLNDTNTNAALFQTSGRVPSTITTSSSLNPASLVNMQAYVTGNVVSVGPSGSGSFGGGCNTPQCGLNAFTLALGGGVFGGIMAFGILFGLIAGLLLYASRQHDNEGHIKGYAVPTWLIGIIALMLLIGMSAAGALPLWIPLVIMSLIAWLWASSIWSHRKNEGGTGAAT